MKRIRLTLAALTAAAMITAAFASSASAANPVFSYNYTIGSGKISGPEGVAVDSAGNIWSAGSGSLWKYSPNGELLATTVIGPNMRDVHIDSSGNIWATSSKYNKIMKFNTKGEEIGSITNFGHLNSPSKFAIDSSGNFWIIDSYYLTAVKLNSKGEFLSEFSLPSGTGPGQFTFAVGIAIDSGGNLWITDNAVKGRVEKFSSAGKYLSQVGEGYLYLPQGDPVFDSEGRLWIADTYHERFAEFKTGAPEAPLQQFSKSGSAPSSLAFDAVGAIWVGQLGYGVQKWDARPETVSEAATGVTTSEATLNGSVNPHGVLSTAQFEISSGGSWAKAAPPESVGEGTTAVKVSLKYSGLAANTIYHFRVKGTNSHGETYGESKWFNTGTHEWGLQPSSEPGEATGTRLQSVSCTASETCVTVGFYRTASYENKTLAKVESAGEWSLTSTPNPSEAISSSLYDVSCSASNACTAVGFSQKTGGTPTALVERWNGSSWSIQSPAVPAGAKSSGLFGIACPAANDCTAVGYYQPEGSVNFKPLAEHWNGTSWSLMTTPTIAGATTSEFGQISCVSSSDCWAVGKSVGASEAALAEHWNGTEWTVNSPSLSKRLADISCASASSCVATAETGLTLARWNGSTWSTETAATPEGALSPTSLTDVSCTSASACVATGEYYGPKGVIRGLAEGWNGSNWSVQSTSAPPFVEEAKKAGEGTATLTGGVSCTSATACTAVGFYRVPGLTSEWSMVEARH